MVVTRRPMAVLVRPCPMGGQGQSQFSRGGVQVEKEKESAEISERESDDWRESADARIFIIEET